MHIFIITIFSSFRSQYSDNYANSECIEQQVSTKSKSLEGKKRQRCCFRLCPNITLISLIVVATCLFFWGKNGQHNMIIRDTTIINFGNVVLNTQLLRTPHLLKKYLFQK